MVVYAIISPLLAALCDKTGNSRTQYMFPIMVVCVACCGILPLATSIQMAGQFTGFMETYGFTGMSVRPIDFTIAAWPVLIVVPLWAILLGPKFTPKQPVVPIEALEKKDSGKAQQKLSPVVDKIGIFLFFASDHLVRCAGRQSADGSVRRSRSEVRSPRYSLGYADALCRRTGSGYCTDQYRCR